MARCDGERGIRGFKALYKKLKVEEEGGCV